MLRYQPGERGVELTGAGLTGPERLLQHEPGAGRQVSTVQRPAGPHCHRGRQRKEDHRGSVAGIQQPPQIGLDGRIGGEEAGIADDRIGPRPGSARRRERVARQLAPALVIPAPAAGAEQQQVQLPTRVAGQQATQPREQQPGGQIPARTQDEQGLPGALGYDAVPRPGRGVIDPLAS